MLVLLGLGVVVLGFLFRFNPLLVVVAAALVTGWAAGLTPIDTVSTIGKAFRESRLVSVALLVLPVVGLLEREGLQERAKMLIGGIRAATAGRVLLIYFAVRQITMALGLPIGGRAQMVRPLIAPMAEAAAESNQPLNDDSRMLVRANAAAADNVAVFFGEDIFIAIGSILLIRGMLQQSGISVEPLSLSLWAIPTAVIALLVHGARLLLLDRRIGARRR
jgi:uncharacterized membrane protein